MKLGLETAIASGGLGVHRGHPVTVVVTTTLAELNRAADAAVDASVPMPAPARTGGGSRLPMRDLIRMAASAIHYLAVFDEHTERPLYLGRQKRIATADQRLICYARDRGCTRPNCLESGYHCEVHHSEDWARGGRTDADKLFFACGPNHGMASRGELRTVVTESGRLGWTDGTGPPEINHAHHPDELLRGNPDPPRRLTWMAMIGDRWNVTDDEVARHYPCDDFVPTPTLQAWRGVTVQTSPETLWRWVSQIRIAPYSYDWIDNLGRRSPQQLVGLPEPVVGESFSTAATRPFGRILAVAAARAPHRRDHGSLHVLRVGTRRAINPPADETCYDHEPLADTVAIGRRSRHGPTATAQSQTPRRTALAPAEWRTLNGCGLGSPAPHWHRLHAVIINAVTATKPA